MLWFSLGELGGKDLDVCGCVCVVVQEEKAKEAAAAAPADAGKEAEEKKGEGGGGEEKKEDAPPPPPEEVVMRVFMHCEGCARKVKKSLRGFDGNGFSSSLLRRNIVPLCSWYTFVSEQRMFSGVLFVGFFSLPSFF